MNPKVKVNLEQSFFCEKPKCKGPRHHRHHKGHEFLFVVRWQGAMVDEKKQKWIERYWQFKEEDLAGLCPRHHAEIHAIYDRVIMADNRARHKRLDDYTYDEAVFLKNRLVKECNKWLKKETKGIDPKHIFGRARTRNQRKAKKAKEAEDGGAQKDTTNH